MKINTIYSKAIKQLEAYFSQKPEIKIAYLFGSVARQDPHPQSDVDIALFLDEHYFYNQLDYRYKATIITDLIELLHTDKVDLVLLNQVSLPIKFYVIYEGILLHSSDEILRVQFESKTMSLYFDQEYYLKRRALENIDHIAQHGIFS